LAEKAAAGDGEDRAAPERQGVGNINAKSTPKNDVLVTAKGIISAFQKREIGTVYPRQAELTSFTLDLTWAS
jgi:hypothetical protein